MTQGGATQRGRERQYLLPPLPVQISSLVPKSATDILDASDESFGSIEARRFRAMSELVAAVIFFGLCLILTALAGAAAVRRHRARAVSTAPVIGPVALVRACVSAVARLEWDVAREGWTPDLAARALAVFRVVGAVALGRPVAQTPVAPRTTSTDAPLRHGQLQVRTGVLGRTRFTVSARTAPPAISRRIAALGASERARREQAMLERVRDGDVFTAACTAETSLDARCCARRPCADGSAPESLAAAAARRRRR